MFPGTLGGGVHAKAGIAIPQVAKKEESKRISGRGTNTSPRRL